MWQLWVLAGLAVAFGTLVVVLVLEGRDPGPEIWSSDDPHDVHAGDVT